MKKSLYFACLLLSLSACGHNNKGEEEISGNYETLIIKRTDITLEQTYPASIEGRQSIRIIPRVDGYLSEIRIKEGQRVRKGQVLFVIDQTTFRAELQVALEKVRNARSEVAATSTDAIARLLDTLGKDSIRYRERFLIPHKADEYLIVPSGDVSHIAIKDGVVLLHTHSGKVYPLGMTLEEAEAQLDPQRFMRVNRQYVVNAAAVEKLSAWFLGKMRVYLKGYPGEEIIVSKEKAASVKRWLDS